MWHVRVVFSQSMHWLLHYVASCGTKSRRTISKKLVTYRNALTANENTIRASDHTVCVSVFLTAKRACVELLPIFPFHTPSFHVGGAVRTALTLGASRPGGRPRAVLHRQDQGSLPTARAGAPTTCIRWRRSARPLRLGTRRRPGSPAVSGQQFLNPIPWCIASRRISGV